MAIGANEVTVRTKLPYPTQKGKSLKYERSHARDPFQETDNGPVLAGVGATASASPANTAAGASGTSGGSASSTSSSSNSASSTAGSSGSSPSPNSPSGASHIVASSVLALAGAALSMIVLA